MSGNLNNISQQHHQQLSMEVIKRPQHNMKLASVLNSMQQSESLVDVTIYCDDGQVNAHKLVLAASSTYFRNLFSRMTNTFHYPIIVLREMSVNDLKTIIQFIYHGEVNVPQNRVESLMRCANYLQIDGMASSANSLNVVLASSSNMSHHALLTAHAVATAGPMSANTNTNNTLNNTTSIHMNSKLHPQYPTTNCKPSRGHGSRSSHANSSANSGAHNSSAANNSDNSSGKPKHTCTICLKTFTHGFTLKRHMKLHSQSRLTIYCDVCSKSYSCKDSYLRHKKSSGHLQHAEYNHRSIDMNLGAGR